MILNTDDDPHLCSFENIMDNQEDCGDSRCSHLKSFHNLRLHFMCKEDLYHARYKNNSCSN